MERKNLAGVIGGWIYPAEDRIQVLTVLEHGSEISGSEDGE